LIQYNKETAIFETDLYNYTIFTPIQFETEEICDRVIELIGQDDLKIFFEIEE
jgi:hypothetical protein